MPVTPSCCCRRPPFHFSDFNRVQLGDDAHGADISVLTCRQCGSMWLEYLVEEPHHSRSGRWWRVEVSPTDYGALSAATARTVVERAAKGFAGGSYFDSRGFEVTAPIDLH